MSDVFKNDIHIDKITVPLDNDVTEYQQVVIKEISNIIKNGDIIATVDSYNNNLINEIIFKKHKNITIISLNKNVKNIISDKSNFQDNNILFFNEDIKSDILKTGVVDIFIGNNILGQYKHNRRLINDSFRFLKNNGAIFFTELISTEKPKTGFKRYFKLKSGNKFNSIIFDAKNRARLLKNCDYEIKTIGNGNFYFDSGDLNFIKEFCDTYGYTDDDIKNIFSKTLLVLIKARIHKK